MNRKGFVRPIAVIGFTFFVYTVNGVCSSFAV